jgi:hypothetical protein
VDKMKRGRREGVRVKVGWGGEEGDKKVWVCWDGGEI